MTGPKPRFEIHESRIRDCLRLTLIGELDLGSSRVLKERLMRLRSKKDCVRLDLSKLEFIDSTGLRLLIQSVGDARMKGWEFRIERDVAPNVMSVFRLVRMERFIG